MKRTVLLLILLLAAIPVSVFAQTPLAPHKALPPQARAPEHFAPLNFKDAAERERLHPPKQPTEIEEIEEPQPPPPLKKAVPIHATAPSKLQSEAFSSFGTGVSPGPSKTFKAEFLSSTTIPPDTM